MKVLIIILFFNLFLRAENIYQNQEYDDLFIKYGKYYNVNPILLKGIGIVESYLNPNSINKNSNKTFDIGLMQINDYWYDKLPKTKKKKKELLKDPNYSIAVAAWIVASNTKNVYNWKTVGNYHSVTPKYRKKWIKKLKKTLKKLRQYKSNQRLEQGFL